MLCLDLLLTYTLASPLSGSRIPLGVSFLPPPFQENRVSRFFYVIFFAREQYPPPPTIRVGVLLYVRKMEITRVKENMSWILQFIPPSWFVLMPLFHDIGGVSMYESGLELPAAQSYFLKLAWSLFSLLILPFYCE